MSVAIEHDRAAQLLMAGDDGLDADAARLRLESAAVVVSADGSASQQWGQAALLAIAAAGVRMFRGGVFVAPSLAGVRLLSHPVGRPLLGEMRRMGCREETAPSGTLRLHVGTDPEGDVDLVCWTEGWVSLIDRSPPATTAAEGNVLSGVLVAAMALAEAFRMRVLSDIRAGRARRSFSAWGHDEPPADATLARLPRQLWLLGLGNLGQACLFTLGLLPYADPEAVQLVLQDCDTAGPENLPVQILTGHDWIGRTKARAAAEWAEARGFTTVVEERRFDATTRPGPSEPRLLLAGVDNLETRRWAAEAGFGLVVDAGLGASAAEAFDLRVHAFPGRRSALEAWPIDVAPPAPPRLSAGLQKLVDENRLPLCGALTIAGKSVGVPSAALAAAAIQISQAIRVMEGGVCCDLYDASLADHRRTSGHVMTHRPNVDLPFVTAEEV